MHVILDRLLGQIQPRCNLFVGETFAQQLYQLMLPSAETVVRSPGDFWLDGDGSLLRNGTEQRHRKCGRTYRDSGSDGADRGCDFHANYWPEAWDGPDGAHEKDAIENQLHRLVCSDRMTLAEAQRRISTDWRHALDASEAP